MQYDNSGFVNIVGISVGYGFGNECCNFFHGLLVLDIVNLSAFPFELSLLMEDNLILVKSFHVRWPA